MVYDHMNTEDQMNLDKIEKALMNAFSMDAFQAYDQFRVRLWNDESPDVYLADLQRLAVLAGIENETIIKRAFIVGLPHDVSSHLRSSARILEMDIAEIVRQARALMTDRVASMGLAAIPRPSTVSATGRQCYGCGQLGHFRNRCPSRPVISCWSCSEKGHTSRDCPKRLQGNAGRETCAPVVSL